MQASNLDDSKAIQILYRNHRGEIAIRKIIPREIIFGSTEWHQENQWLLVAFDFARNADRSFALKDIRALF